ncbi:hypothetical protein [Arthrobacter sp. NEB 688]|uniref:hypothetical protein n=1 Tax=Arthrobacter sp. NEB 688 TaxID=904039 RepID=UPI001564CE7B|nr:hypothetical protein [Arthrobacter sp. NEB 688]QKE85395.1 hypothetical protein HL663_16620 [Arthrobacter sp. NEB 688]
MRARSVLAALLLATVGVVVLQRFLVVFPSVATVVAAVLGAGLLVALERRRDADVLVAAAGVGLATTLASMVGLAAAGTQVLAAVYLAGWVVVAMLSAGVGVGTVWLGGLVVERGSDSPSRLR